MTIDDSPSGPAPTSFAREMEPEMFRLLVEAAPTPMIAVSEEGRIVMVNRATERLVLREARELIGELVETLLPEGMAPLHQEYREGFRKNPEPRPMGQGRDFFLLAADGSTVPVEIGLSPVETPGGLVVLCTMVDLTVRKERRGELLQAAARLKRRNRRLSRQASTDGLTSLRNRQAFLDHLSAQVEASVRHARPVSLLILDIDDFKGYNDTFGHLAGDEILRGVGATLRGAARRSDVLGRMGGEEFGIILPETDRKGTILFAERFREAIEKREWPLRPVTVSVGATTVAISDTVPRADPPALSLILSQADQALYRSKETGKNRVTHFEERGEDSSPELGSKGSD